jgi:D-lyxose ketol-isomerase
VTHCEKLSYYDKHKNVTNCVTPISGSYACSTLHNHLDLAPGEHLTIYDSDNHPFKVEVLSLNEHHDVIAFTNLEATKAFRAPLLDQSYLGQPYVALVSHNL